MKLTQPALNDRYGAVQLLNGFFVLEVEAEGQTELVVSLSKQSAV